MAGPARIFQNFTLPQLQAALAACVEEIASGGAITSTSGGGKGAGFQVMDVRERLREINYEYQMRGITPPRPQKVKSILDIPRAGIF
jgi:hypothetical protein